MSLPPSLVFLFMVQGIYSQSWGVWYRPDSICAVKGSSVTMPCSYTYPSGYRVETVYWTKNENGNRPALSEEPAYRGRFQYLGDKQSDCSMKLSDVRERDAVMYLFRFETDKTGGKWTGSPGVQLSVTDLQMETPERVKEGDTVTLKCRTTCSLSNSPTFIWYKNGQVLTRKNMKNNELSLQSVSPSGEIVEGSSVTLICSSDANPPATYTWFQKNGTVSIGKEETYRINKISSEDSGEYHCKSNNKQGHQYSNTVSLNVLYPPKKTTVSVSPSGEIVEGGSVTLTCSSDANPPATYTWFMKNGTVTIGKEETYRINKISSEDSGEYHCKSTNQHGHQYANAVSLNVLYPPRNTTVSVNASGQIVAGSSVTLTCSSDANPPQINYTWYKENVTSPVGYGQSYIINNIQSNNSGLYYCEAQNKHGSQRTTAVPIKEKGMDTVIDVVI
ncbi:B-cell receptor CD22-like [Chanos chanos]|uniref:B-cell receptor CD22-like n=1 Tax=Chanos chanos TaxID=29144 RepID=A0A6J2VRY9_CHACN|nr:B-cell receptor CD22-like [Chanos chanos]